MPPEQILLHIPTRPLESLILSAPGTLSGRIEKLIAMLDGGPVAIISDDTVANLYSNQLVDALQRKNIDTYLFTFPAGEMHKTHATVAALQDEMLNNGLSKGCSVIDLGGGVVTDVAGFLAAIHCRGVPLLLIPTTLLAMVDAAIGGKNGVNSPFAKNMAGTIYLPKAVLIDDAALQSLSKDQLRGGLAEMVKHALIASVEQYRHLELHQKAYINKDASIPLSVILDNLRIKVEIVQQDPNDKGIRRLLNYGHTVAHALESLSNYHLAHGDAVLAGLAIEITCSYLNDTLQQSTWQRIITTLTQLFPRSQLPLVHASAEEIWQCMILDKKSKNGIPHITFIEDIAKPLPAHGQWCQPLPRSLFDAAINWYKDAVFRPHRT